MYSTSTVIFLRVDARVICLSILLVQCNICNVPLFLCFIETWTLNKHPDKKAYVHTCLKCVFLFKCKATSLNCNVMRTDMHTNLACIAGIHAICWQLCTNVFIYPDRVKHCALNILTFIIVMWMGRLQNDYVRDRFFFFFFLFFNFIKYKNYHTL